MINAISRFIPIADRRLLDRDDAIFDALQTVMQGREISQQAEQDIWVAARVQIEAILHLADDATVARLEAEATLRRIVAHLRTHEGCTAETPCGALRLNILRRERLADKADRAYLALAKGRRP